MSSSGEAIEGSEYANPGDGAGGIELDVVIEGIADIGGVAGGEDAGGGQKQRYRGDPRHVVSV